MVSTETDLKDDVREFTGYTSQQVLSNDGLDVAYRKAKRHIRLQKSLSADYDWFESDKVAAQEALFWFTCLFSKVQTGELDSQGIQAGAIDHDTLLAKDDDEVTTWYRNAYESLDSINPFSIIQSSSPARSEREYQTGSFERDDGGPGGDEGGDGPTI